MAAKSAMWRRHETCSPASAVKIFAKDRESSGRREYRKLFFGLKLKCDSCRCIGQPKLEFSLQAVAAHEIVNSNTQKPTKAYSKKPNPLFKHSVGGA